MYTHIKNKFLNFEPLEDKNVYYLGIIVHLIGLISAYTLEKFGYAGCRLCMYERIPYFLVVIFCTVSLIKEGRYLNVCIIVSLCMSIVLSLYHTMLELGLVDEIVRCSLNKDIINSVEGIKNIEGSLKDIENIKNSIFQNDAISCKHPDFKIGFLSLANINLIVSVFIGVIMIRKIYYVKN